MLRSGPRGSTAAAGAIVAALCVAIMGSALLSSCGAYATSPALIWTFNNTTDPTNAGAGFIGSAACGACHPDKPPIVINHGHSQALKAIQDGPPQYPAEGTRAGVPNPPGGLPWSAISYVIAGYIHGANFLGTDGFVMTDGVEGFNTQWDLLFPPNGTTPSFAAFMPAQVTPLPYQFDTCFKCHTTNPQPQDPANPLFQENRPGILGTWSEPAVHCEACHGPGSNHAPDPQARLMFVDSTNSTCARCHLQGNDPNVIVVQDGFINPNTQYAELLASGGMSDFNCTVCHDPHFSTLYDPANGIRNDCQACHPDQNLAFHEGITFVRGDYTEQLACVSCHMPFAGRSASNAGLAVVGTLGGRMGDVHTHIFRIDTVNATFTQMFNAAGTEVVKDSEGEAAVTPDFVCLRCHNGIGNAFIISASGAAELGATLHTNDALAQSTSTTTTP
ncbi:MAG TPA: hypothetical protein VMV94_09350 [Phycisphaerae bacterium]|nr:hypothetical protein [Phycisphaerae bacterium]